MKPRSFQSLHKIGAYYNGWGVSKNKLALADGHRPLPHVQKKSHFGLKITKHF